MRTRPDDDVRLWNRKEEIRIINSNADPSPQVHVPPFGFWIVFHYFDTGKWGDHRGAGKVGRGKVNETMNGKSQASKKISRRGFLKAGCLGAAAFGVTVCGGAGLVSALTPALPPVELKSFSFGEENMRKVLIAYASRTGTTVEIAEAIGKTLGGRGFPVDVHPIKENPSLAGYQAALIGSAINGGKWLPEAIDFVRANQTALQTIPVELFLVHFFFRGDSENDRRMRALYMEEVGPLAPHAPVTYFAGRFDRRTTAVGIPEWLARLTPTIDRRDWGKIRAWAETVFA